MKTIINIATNVKTIRGAIFYKPFEEITSQDIRIRCQDVLGLHVKFKIEGWCNVTPKN